MLLILFVLISNKAFLYRRKKGIKSLRKLVNAFTPIFGKDTSREFKDAQKELDNLDKEISEEDANTLFDIDDQKKSLENEGIFPGDAEWDHLDAKENAIFPKENYILL